MSSWTWNWNYFSIFGYVGAGLAGLVLVLWLIHFGLKAKPFVCHLALLLAVAGFVLNLINSVTHVNRIQLDPAAQKAAFEAQQAAKREALLESRGSEVAEIRFAEDGENEFLDRAGMDETDLKYLDKLNESAEPEWKKEKKARSDGGGSGEEGMDSESLDEAAEAEPILMAEADMTMANRLDLWNLRIARWLVLLGIGIVVVDHLRRANIYGEAYFPLPLPSSFVNALTPYPPVLVRPGRPRRSMAKELAWLIRRGDSFVYLTDDRAAADEVMAKLRRLEKRRGVEILRPGEDGLDFSDDFAFEAWWFGRASIVIDNAERAERLVNRFLKLLEQRRGARARVAQTAHLVWDMGGAMPRATREAFDRLAKRTGVSLFLCQNTMGARDVSSAVEPVGVIAG